MADDLLTLTDLTTLNDAALADINVSDLFDSAPVVAALAATMASNGTVHKYLKETGAPVVGFRAVNAGRDHDSSIDTAVTATLEYLDAGHTIDVAIADSFVRGGASALIARESRRHLKAAFFQLEKQIFQGVNNDSGGFVGFEDATSLDALADAMVTGAGGSTALSSVYLIRSVGDQSGVSVVAGNDGDISIGDSVIQRVEDGSSLHYFAYSTPIGAYYGLQIGGAYSVHRIANLDAGSNSLDDDQIAAAMSTFRAGEGATMLAMGARSLEQLRASRTATNPTGAPAPIPAESHGLPIFRTDAIGVAETAVT